MRPNIEVMCIVSTYESRGRVVLCSIRSCYSFVVIHHRIKIMHFFHSHIIYFTSDSIEETVAIYLQKQ